MAGKTREPNQAKRGGAPRGKKIGLGEAVKRADKSIKRETSTPKPFRPMRPRKGKAAD
jgi:hypothetical protein